MNSGNLFAFYGSLRRGMENYAHYRNELHYMFSARIQGFQLYSRGAYPHAVKSSAHHSIVVEVFRIDNEATRKSIDQLELDEGYYIEYVTIHDSPVKIYLFHEPGNYQEVIGGDWVTFFRERGNK
jgi:gamma-glutamylcyclotransferase (GGCT)/AIG2-like uncharacterized protein YtfP